MLKSLQAPQMHYQMTQFHNQGCLIPKIYLKSQKGNEYFQKAKKNNQQASRAVDSVVCLNTSTCITSCPLMERAWKILTTSSLTYLKERRPFSIWENQDDAPLLITVPKDSRHVVLHRILSTASVSENQVFFEGQAVMAFITKIAKVRNWRVFSTIESDYTVAPCNQESL